MRKYYTVADPHSFVSQSGDTDIIQYMPSVNDDGTVQLTEFDRVAIQPQINALAESCDLSIIVSRLRAGDTSGFRTDGLYGDFTQMPKTYAEMLTLSLRATAAFDSLPQNIRESFGMSKYRWLSSAGSEEWAKKMGFVSDKPSVEDVPVVKEDLNLELKS